MQYIQQPQAIEAKSFDIISEIIAETRPDYRFASPLQIQPASGGGKSVTALCHQIGRAHV